MKLEKSYVPNTVSIIQPSKSNLKKASIAIQFIALHEKIPLKM